MGQRLAIGPGLPDSDPGSPCRLPVYEPSGEPKSLAGDYGSLGFRLPKIAAFR